MHMTSRCRSRQALLVERLESRNFLAGDVSAYVSGQMVVIWGDAEANGVTLTYSSNTNSYHVAGHDAGGSPTTINGLDTSISANVPVFYGVKQVAVLLNGGDDEFEVGSAAAVDTFISKWMSITMGEGNDQVVVGRAGNDSGGADPVATRFQTGTSLTVALGDGNDDLSLANADIGLALT